MLEPRIRAPISVCLGAIGGALCRHYIGDWLTQTINTGLPLGTLVVNLSGCFLMGLITTLATEKLLLKRRQQLDVYLDYAQAAVEAIETRAQAKAETQKDLDLANLSSLSQPGPHDFEQKMLTVTNPALRETGVGLSVNYDFPVDVYIPQGLSQPAPVVIVSHGFGAIKENFGFIAEHLASYGFVVLVPEHIGSDLSFRQTYLEGRLNTLD